MKKKKQRIIKSNQILKKCFANLQQSQAILSCIQLYTEAFPNLKISWRFGKFSRKAQTPPHLFDQYPQAASQNSESV